MLQSWCRNCSYLDQNIQIKEYTQWRHFLLQAREWNSYSDWVDTYNPCPWVSRIPRIFTCYTLLKPKRHSLRCHGFVVYALLLRMHTNVVDFRVMRRLCRREWNWQWNWQSVNQHSWDPRQRTTWSRRVTSDFNSVLSIGTRDNYCVISCISHSFWVTYVETDVLIWF